MKKLLSILLAVCLACGVSVMFAGCTPRAEKLIISNWGEYMSDEVYKGFESWYKEKTGLNVKVEFDGREFETNEELYQKLTVGKADYDLVVPSDYMIERMVREEMLLKLDDDTIEVINKNIDPAILEFAANYDPTGEYAMPYLWGTMGILFNSKSEGQNADMMKSWSALWDDSFKNQVFMKDSPKDSYTITMLHLNSDALMAAKETYGVESDEYQDLLMSIYKSTDDTKLAAAKAELQKQLGNDIVLEYDTDYGKMQILLDRKAEQKLLGMFWSCDAGYIMNGDAKEGANKDVMYVVPEEGSNVWIDNFVIPKNAVNVDAANWFIRYICEKDIAYDCMDYAGTTTAVLAAAEQYKEDLENDSAFFLGTTEAFKTMYMDMLFPPADVLARCGIMRDFGNDKNTALSRMWEDVKIHKN